MPVAMSIQWRPLRDSHYIVASLQPGSGGLRQIFARQSTLRELQAIARANAIHPVVGLLLGSRWDCSLTLTPYVLIESHAEVALASLDERAVSDAIRTLHAQVRRRNSGEVLGWYCSSRSADVAVSRMHAAVHAAFFAERWQTVLIVGEGGNTGAFFLHDSSAARWFHAPFSEVTESKASNRTRTSTCVTWPAYLTTASVVPLAETPQQALLPPPRAFVAAPASPPAHQHSVAVARPVARPRRTLARDAIAGVGRAAVAALRAALVVAKILGGGAVTASRHATERIVRIRAEWAATAARRKAEADAARAREAERRAKEAAERRAAREEAQRRAAEVEKQHAAEAEARRAAEAEARRKAAEEAERRRAAEEEARRQAAEAEAQRRAEAAEADARRRAEEAEARRAAEAQRKAAEEAQRRAAEEEARRKAAEEAQRRAAEEDRRRAAEAEADRQAAEAEARRQAAEAAEEERRRAAEAEADRQAAEAEARRQAAEAEAEARRQAAEAEEDARRKLAAAEEDARRKAAAAEEEARRKAAEAEALRISVEVTAIRERLARTPAEGSKREAPKVAPNQPADLEDTTAADGPYRYLGLARREGFELSEKIERGSPEHSETVWLMHEKQSGLRLIVVTTDVAVREASLHYNLRTEDDSLLRLTAPEHRDLESRTIYGREPCLHDLRARCRRLRATGALERDWKVSPTSQPSVSPQVRQYT